MFVAVSARLTGVSAKTNKLEMRPGTLAMCGTRLNTTAWFQSTLISTRQVKHENLLTNNSL